MRLFMTLVSQLREGSSYRTLHILEVGVERLSLHWLLTSQSVSASVCTLVPGPPGGPLSCICLDFFFFSSTYIWATMNIPDWPLTDVLVPEESYIQEKLITLALRFVLFQIFPGQNKLHIWDQRFPDSLSYHLKTVRVERIMRQQDVWSLPK